MNALALYKKLQDSYDSHDAEESAKLIEQIVDAPIRDAHDARAKVKLLVELMSGYGSIELALIRQLASWLGCASILL